MNNNIKPLTEEQLMIRDIIKFLHTELSDDITDVLSITYDAFAPIVVVRVKDTFYHVPMFFEVNDIELTGDGMEVVLSIRNDNLEKLMVTLD